MKSKSDFSPYLYTNAHTHRYWYLGGKKIFAILWSSFYIVREILFSHVDIGKFDIMCRLFNVFLRIQLSFLPNILFYFGHLESSRFPSIFRVLQFLNFAGFDLAKKTKIFLNFKRPNTFRCPIGLRFSVISLYISQNFRWITSS